MFLFLKTEVTQFTPKPRTCKLVVNVKLSFRQENGCHEKLISPVLIAFLISLSMTDKYI